MARNLAAQSFWMYGPFPCTPELRGGLFCSGFAFQYAARAQAWFQILVFARLLPTASLENKVVVTNVLTSSLSLCRNQVTLWSASRAAYEAPQSFAPCAYNSVMDNVAGSSAFAGIANVKDEHASMSRLRTGGAAPSAGESHFGFQSNCFEWHRRDDAFDVRDKVSDDEREEV